jgi:hypothetical protein
MKMEISIDWIWFLYESTNFLWINFYVKIMSMAAERNFEAV